MSVSVDAVVVDSSEKKRVSVEAVNKSTTVVVSVSVTVVCVKSVLMLVVMTVTVSGVTVKVACAEQSSIPLSGGKADTTAFRH